MLPFPSERNDHFLLRPAQNLRSRSLMRGSHLGPPARRGSGATRKLQTSCMPIRDAQEAGDSRQHRRASLGCWAERRGPIRRLPTERVTDQQYRARPAWDVRIWDLWRCPSVVGAPLMGTVFQAPKLRLEKRWTDISCANRSIFCHLYLSDFESSVAYVPTKIHTAPRISIEITIRSIPTMSAVGSTQKSDGSPSDRQNQTIFEINPNPPSSVSDSLGECPANSIDRPAMRRHSTPIPGSLLAGSPLADDLDPWQEDMGTKSDSDLPLSRMKPHFSASLRTIGRELTDSIEAGQSKSVSCVPGANACHS